MRQRDAFAGFHPVNNFLYFVIVLAMSMFSMNPVILLLSLTGAVCYSIKLKGTGKFAKSLLYMIPLLLFTAAINPVFNHQGITILTYLPNGNPLTLESMLYGFFAATMMITVITWFSCYTEIMTSDKFVYLFGRIIPSLSLLLSMTLRFVPKFRAQYREVKTAQQCIGGKDEGKRFTEKLRIGVRILSILITWAMENAIETADSMKSRGYGLPGRTAFSIYTFDKRDRAMLVWLLAGAVILSLSRITGGMYFRFYPSIKMAEAGFFSILADIVFLLLCLTPSLVDLYDDYVWRKLDAVRN